MPLNQLSVLTKSLHFRKGFGKSCAASLFPLRFIRIPYFTTPSRPSARPFLKRGKGPPEGGPFRCQDLISHLDNADHTVAALIEVRAAGVSPGLVQAHPALRVPVPTGHAGGHGIAPTVHRDGGPAAPGRVGHSGEFGQWPQGMAPGSFPPLNTSNTNFALNCALYVARAMVCFPFLCFCLFYHIHDLFPGDGLNLGNHST